MKKSWSLGVTDSRYIVRAFRDLIVCFYQYAFIRFRMAYLFVHILPLSFESLLVPAGGDDSGWMTAVVHSGWMTAADGG